MKNIILGAIMLSIVNAGCTQQNSNSKITKNKTEMNKQENQAITNLLHNYERALNASDTKSILGMYTTDGVFMPSEAPSSIGKEAVEGAYNYVFSQIKLNIVFTIDEIEQYGDVAFARTISRGTTDILAAGIKVPEENRELFVLKKEDGDWKIARYMFNKMSPPAQ